MSAPLGTADIEERACERAEELAQKRTGLSLDDLPPQEQMKLWTEAEQQVREELNEAAERAWEGRHEEVMP